MDAFNLNVSVVDIEILLAFSLQASYVDLEKICHVGVDYTYPVSICKLRFCIVCVSIFVVENCKQSFGLAAAY